MDDNIQEEFFTSIILGRVGEVMDFMLEHPDAISWHSPAGYPPLHMAILNHQQEIAILLVEFGAGLEQKGQGETAASLAGRKGMLEKLEDATARQGQRRSEAIAACGDRMHVGLKQPVSVARKPLSLKQKP